MEEREKEIVKIYLKNSGLPKRLMQNSSLYPTVKADVEAFDRLDDYTKHSSEFVNLGDNLLIYGSVCNGKSTWASKFLKSYIINYACKYAYPEGTPALFINVPQFLARKKTSISDDSLKEELNRIERCLYKASLVVFDDIATNSDMSNYDLESLYAYIDYRTSQMKSSIYTTNVPLDRLEQIIGPKLFSRVSGYSHKVEITGPDMRGEIV